MKRKLYYHKTDGGSEYLTDKGILCPDGTMEGVFEGAAIIVRFDGNIRRDSEIMMRGTIAAAPDLLTACELALAAIEEQRPTPEAVSLAAVLQTAIAKAKGE